MPSIRVCSDEDTELTCYALQSRLRTQQTVALREARKLWFTGKGQPDSCGMLFEAALSAGIINEKDIRHRLRLALETNNVSLAVKLASLSEQLDDKYAGFSAMMKSAAADPDRYLKKLIPDNSDHANHAESRRLPKRASDTAIEAQVSGHREQPVSEFAGKSRVRSVAAITLPPPGWFGWENILSRLGLSKKGGQPAADQRDDPAPIAPLQKT